MSIIDNQWYTFFFFSFSKSGNYHVSYYIHERGQIERKRERKKRIRGERNGILLRTSDLYRLD